MHRLRLPQLVSSPVLSVSFNSGRRWRPIAGAGGTGGSQRSDKPKMTAGQPACFGVEAA
jgi:hypothetical protein